MFAADTQKRKRAFPRYHRRKARNPFSAQLSCEFGRSESHIHRLLSGERTQSPLRDRVLARQRELIAAAQR